MFGQPVLGDADSALIAAYVASGLTLDDLPYTDQFAALHKQVGAGKPPGEVFRRLHNLRKASKLPKLGRASSPAIKVNEDEEQQLVRCVLRHVKTLGERDSLLYTDAFDEVVAEFGAATGRNLTPHDVWRLLAKIAK